jgi:hypothetical protein
MAVNNGPAQQKMSYDQYNFKLSGLGDDNTGKNNGILSATMLNTLNFTGTNSFSTSGEMVRDGSGGLQGVGDRVGAKVGDFVNNKVHGRTLGGIGKFNKRETRAKWTDSGKPQISVEFMLLANSAADADSNIEKILLLKSAVLPLDDGGALLAPLGYRGGTQGTLIFSLGTWFVANNLVMISESCQPSSQVMSNGYPLSWHCLFTLEPYETITINDFIGWFQQPAVLGSSAGGTGLSPTTTSLTSKLSNFVNGNGFT